MTGISPSSPIRFILLLMVAMAGTVALRAFGASSTSITAFTLLTYSILVLTALLRYEMRASHRAIVAKDYNKAKMYARGYLSCMPWLRWVQPLMRLCGGLGV